MMQLFIEGKAIKEIGKEFGISRQRAHQILKKYLPMVGGSTSRQRKK